MYPVEKPVLRDTFYVAHVQVGMRIVQYVGTRLDSNGSLTFRVTFMVRHYHGISMMRAF